MACSAGVGFLDHAVPLSRSSAPGDQLHRCQRRAQHCALRASFLLARLRPGTADHIQGRGLDDVARDRIRLSGRLPACDDQAEHPRPADLVGVAAVLDELSRADVRLDRTARPEGCSQPLARGTRSRQRAAVDDLQFHRCDDRHDARADAARHPHHDIGHAADPDEPCAGSRYSRCARRPGVLADLFPAFAAGRCRGRAARVHHRARFFHYASAARRQSRDDDHAGDHREYPVFTQLGVCGLGLDAAARSLARRILPL